MPRALIADVRSLANADSPILPFLAPRVFAASPFRSAVPRRNARISTQSKKEKEEKGAGDIGEGTRWGEGLRSTVSRSKATLGDGCRTRLPHRACSSQTTSTVSARRFKHPLVLPSNSWSSRSAAKPTFIRKQSAPYATESHRQASGRRGPTEVRRVVSKHNVLHRSSTSHPSGIKIWKTKFQRPNKSLSTTPDEEMWLVNHRRKKALKKVLERYEKFKPQTPATGVRSLPLQGRYRSLRRQLYVLKQDKVAKLVMSRLCRDSKTIVFNQGLAALDRMVYPGNRRKSHFIGIQHDPVIEETALKICEGMTTPDHERMMLNWLGYDEAYRNMSWHLVLFYLLQRAPDNALHFIRVIAEGQDIRNLAPEILADSLEHIARLCAKPPATRLHVPNKSDFIPVFSYIFREHLARFPAICSQDLLWNVARLASLEDLRYVFDLIIEFRAFAGYDTVLHYASTFGKYGDHQYALRCLQHIIRLASCDAARENLVNRQRFCWSCALILRKSTSESKDYHSTTEIVAAFLKLGVKMDILLYNVIMHNAMEAGDYATAFRIYNLLGDNGLEPDKYTYSILLHGCTTNNNPAMFLDFADHCAVKAKELRDPWLATDYLYYLYVRHHKDGPQQLAAVLSNAYSQFFSPGPLEPFLQPSNPAIQDVWSENVGFPQLEPPPLAVYIVLQAEIERALSIDNTRVWKLYQFFKRMVSEGKHSVLDKLAKECIVWNAFLFAFCRKKQFANASQLIKSMTDGELPNIPQPNVYSWNIFMQAFFKNDQVRPAERIYEIMRSRGVEPDQFTYGVLLRGYAKAQHVDKVGEVIGHIKNEQQLDPAVLQALTRVHDRKRLMFALEQSRLAKQEEEKKELEAKEEERQRRWERPRFKPVFSKPRLSLSELQSTSDESPQIAILKDEDSVSQRASSTLPLDAGSHFLAPASGPRSSSAPRSNTGPRAEIEGSLHANGDQRGSDPARPARKPKD